MDTYVLLGNPIAHTLSPLIYRHFAASTGQQIAYSAIEVELNDLGRTLDTLQAQGVKGANITLPFKQSAFTLVDTVSERARLAGAINFIQFNNDGKRFGDNTDGAGLLRDLTINHQLNLREKKILLLGAGGAARGVIAPLLAEQPTCVTIANRTAHKATTLAQLFSGLGPIEASDLNNLNGSFNLVINATSASLHGCIPGLSPLVVKNTFCYDMVYAAAATPFLRWAKEQGAADCTDGLGMLVEQAAEAFYVWRGVRWSRSLK